MKKEMFLTSLLFNIYACLIYVVIVSITVTKEIKNNLYLIFGLCIVQMC